MKKVLTFLLLFFWPLLLPAQTYAGEIRSLQSVLDQLYSEMLPLSSQLTGVGRGLAGFAALWYISSRVWRHLANAEPIDFYPLLRPFAIGLAILLFPSVLAIINAIMSPTVSGTAAMVSGSNNAIAYLIKLKEEAVKKTPAWQMYVGADGAGDRDKWYQYTHPDGSDEGTLEGLSNDIQFAMAKASYNFRNSVKQWMSEILQILFEGAALCLNTIRTFYLVVLSIMGPIVFGISVFDGFQHTLTSWLARYINVFLWLPVANIFGAIIARIQENMLRIDLEQIARYGDTFFSSTDTAYLIFLVMGIVGYFTVPSVCNYIVQAAGGNVLLHKATTFFVGGATSAVSTAVAGSSTAVGMADRALGPWAGQSSGGGDGSRAGSSSGTNDEYMRGKLSGN